MSAVRDDGRLLPSRSATVLTAAEISPSKLGPARSAGLTTSQRDLYSWILRNFATLNFFAAAAHAEQWLEQHGDVRGEVVTIRDAADAGRVVFGDLLAGI
jgi:hypothetical protein